MAWGVGFGLWVGVSSLGFPVISLRPRGRHEVLQGVVAISNGILKGLYGDPPLYRKTIAWDEKMFGRKQSGGFSDG